MPLDDGFGLFGASQRQPPQNVHAEQALLGALLHNNKALSRCGTLAPEHFAVPEHGAVFQAITEGHGQGRIVDAVLLRDRFDHGLLAGLLTSTIGIEPAGDYAATVRNCWALRQLIDLGTELVNAAFANGAAVDLAREAAILIDQVGARDTADRSVSLDRAIDQAVEAMDRGGALAGISSGFGCIDQRLGGLEPGLVYVLAGRPGMGKSALGHQIGIRAARAGVGVLELSLEMSATQLGRRALATASGLPIGLLKRGGLNESAAGAVVAARKELRGLPLTIDDTAGQSPAQIATKARAARRKHGLGLVMIDHLNLMRAEEADARNGGTWATERASATVLQMAKDCECPVLLLAQLNRGVEGREDKRPGLSDLRQAGAIEQDAYSVMFVYRPEYYLGGKPEAKAGEHPSKTEARLEEWHEHKGSLAGKAELIWAKVRDGEPGTDALNFHGPTATFQEPE